MNVLVVDLNENKIFQVGKLTFPEPPSNLRALFIDLNKKVTGNKQNNIDDNSTIENIRIFLL